MTSRERPPGELRHVRITQGYTDMTPGSVLIEMGRTRVLCTASIEAEVPRWTGAHPLQECALVQSRFLVVTRNHESE